MSNEPPSHTTLQPEAAGSAYIPFNLPFLTGKELAYIEQAVRNGHISGNGTFTKACHDFFRKEYGFERCLLTSSCTDALEMCALLLDIQPGDEVILPAYTFVSTANAFALRGARLKFADSSSKSPNIDPMQVERLMTPRTRAIVVVHYGGIACDLERLMAISQEHGVPLIEDAAHAIDSFFLTSNLPPRPLGSFGSLATFSFHETKNIICGEGGMLVVNDPLLWRRAEILWEKGTDRASFARGEVRKYQWVDLGSSFLPSDIIAAFLLSQLQSLRHIQDTRVDHWQKYRQGLARLADEGHIEIPEIPSYATVNGHLFTIVTKELAERDRLIKFLEAHRIQALFHYLPLNESPYFTANNSSTLLPQAHRYAECLLRLPLFYKLRDEQIAQICDAIVKFYDGEFGAC